MEPRSFARRRCPMCCSSNALNAPICDMCGYAFDQSEVQIVVPSGGTISRQEAGATMTMPAAAVPSAAIKSAARPAAQQTVHQRPQPAAQPASASQAERQQSRPASVPVPISNKTKPSGSNGKGGSVAMQRTGAKPAMKQSDKAANLARLLSSTNTNTPATSGAGSTAARVSPHAQASQLGIWMLISLLVLVGAVLATAAIFMNSTVRP